MEKKKPKVNAKKFLEDFRAGKSDEDLMSLHGLDQRGLNKVLRILVERKLLDEAELLAGHSFRSAAAHEAAPLRNSRRGVRSALDSHDEPRADLTPRSHPRLHRPSPIPGSDTDGDTTCPQCGAAVTKKALTCPECGHVLPGEERWANVEPKRGFFDRVPPKLLGALVALPVAAVVLYVFKDMIVPIAEVKIERQREAFKQELAKSRESIQAAKEVARKRGVRGVQAVVERLIAEEILQSVEPDYSTFVAGPRWKETSLHEKELHLSEIRSAMRKANMDGEFDLIDSGGGLLARVNQSSIKFGGGDDNSDATWSPEEKNEPPGARESVKDILRRNLERRLSPDKPRGSP